MQYGKELTRMHYKTKWMLLVACILVVSIATGYFLIRTALVSEKASPAEVAQDVSQNFGDYFFVRIYYPLRGRILFREIRLPKRTKQLAIAEAVIEEFFREPDAEEVSYVPHTVRLRGLYRDPDKILYIDLSNEFQRNFHGDALMEYLLLKSLHESLLSNLQEFRDFKILVEGKEIETLGGHYFLKHTLNNTLLYEYTGEE